MWHASTRFLLAIHLTSETPSSDRLPSWVAALPQLCATHRGHFKYVQRSNLTLTSQTSAATTNCFHGFVTAMSVCANALLLHVPRSKLLTNTKYAGAMCCQMLDFQKRLP